jgi:hypothetical protein
LSSTRRSTADLSDQRTDHKNLMALRAVIGWMRIVDSRISQNHSSGTADTHLLAACSNI